MRVRRRGRDGVQEAGIYLIGRNEKCRPVGQIVRVFPYGVAPIS